MDKIIDNGVFLLQSTITEITVKEGNWQVRHRSYCEKAKEEDDHAGKNVSFVISRRSVAYM